MSSITNVSRRGFLIGLAEPGAFCTGSVAVPAHTRVGAEIIGLLHGADLATLHPNVFRRRKHRWNRVHCRAPF